MHRLLSTIALLSTLIATAAGCAGSAEDEPNDATSDALSFGSKTTIEDGFYGDGTGNFVRVQTPLLFGAQSFQWAFGTFNTGTTTAGSMNGDTVTGFSTRGGGSVELKADGANIAFRSITMDGATDYKLAKTSLNGFYADPDLPRLQFQIANTIGIIADLVVYDNTAPVYRAPLTVDTDAPMTMSYVTMCGTVSLVFEGAKGGTWVRFDSQRDGATSPDCIELAQLSSRTGHGARIVRYK